MPDPNRADESVAEEGLGAHLRREGSEHANLEIDLPLPERKRILVGLGREAQADLRRGLGDGRHQGRGETSMNPSLARMVKVRSSEARSR